MERKEETNTVIVIKIRRRGTAGPCHSGAIVGVKDPQERTLLREAAAVIYDMKSPDRVIARRYIGDLNYRDSLWAWLPWRRREVYCYAPYESRVDTWGALRRAVRDEHRRLHAGKSDIRPLEPCAGA